MGTAAKTFSPAELKELMLRAPKFTLGVAESLTCGWVQARVGAISGASDFFRGGLTAYELAQKVKHLGVDRAAAEPVNAVSAQVAEQMARGACTFFSSELGLATTGYAEPSPGQNVAEPYAFWGIAHVQRDGAVVAFSGRVEFPGADRVQVQQRVSDAALCELVAYLRRVRG